MPIIRPQDFWLVPLTIISIVLIAIGQIPVGVCLFLFSCIVIYKVYGSQRTFIHIVLSGIVLIVGIKVI
jgi:hypothetical protein